MRKRIKSPSKLSEDTKAIKAKELEATRKRSVRSCCTTAEKKKAEEAAEIKS